MSGKERRRVQELCEGLDREVVGVGLITCVRVGLVKRTHTLFGRNAPQVVVFKLLVLEEVEGVRQEVREVKRDSKVEERRSLHEHVDDIEDKHKTHDLSQGECARDDVTMCRQTRRTVTMRAHTQTLWKSVKMVMSSLVFASCIVTTQ